jgi:hypothetical protein
VCTKDMLTAAQLREKALAVKVKEVRLRDTLSNLDKVLVDAANRGEMYVNYTPPETVLVEVRNNLIGRGFEIATTGNRLTISWEKANAS